MKIGIICSPTVGGSGALATELGIWLAERGHEIHFISYEMPFRLRESYISNVYYHTVTLQHYDLLKYPPYTMALAVKIAEVAEWHNLDILHVHYAIPHAVSAFLAREMLGGSLKYITTMHGTDVTLIGQDPSFKDLTSMAVEKSDSVTTVSHSLKKDAISQLGIEKNIEVIHNFIDPKKYYPQDKKEHFHPETRDGEKIIVHISNFRYLKKVDDTLRAFNEIQKEISARLYLIGDGESMNEIHHLCRQFGICDKVEFLGEQDSVACILPRCDLFLLNSQLESFGLAALEAMACGVPVVCTNVGGLPEVIENDKEGFLVEVGDIEDMKNKALKILLPENHSRFKKAALEKSLKSFNINTIGPQYEDIYQRTLNGQK